MALYVTTLANEDAAEGPGLSGPPSGPGILPCGAILPSIGTIRKRLYMGRNVERSHTG